MVDTEDPLNGIDITDLIDDDPVDKRKEDQAQEASPSFKFRTSSNTASCSNGATSSSYRASDAHRETLKLLLQVSPQSAKKISNEELKDALNKTLCKEAGEEGNVYDLDRLQTKLESELDVVDLSSMRDVIKDGVEAYKTRQREEKKERIKKLEKEKLLKKQEEEVPPKQKEDVNKAKKELESQEEIVEVEDDDDSQALSQQSMDLSQATVCTEEDGRRQKKARPPGGRSELPLVFPKNVASKASSTSIQSVLVELDERDKAQDLTGDSGAVGRVHVSKKQKRAIVLDLKGHQYLAEFVRCSTLLLVSVGEEEAKVEDMVENLCLLTHQHDHLEALGGQVIKGQSQEDQGDGFMGSDDDDVPLKLSALGGCSKRTSKASSDANKNKKLSSKKGGTGDNKPAAKKRKASSGKTKKSRVKSNKSKATGPKRVSLKKLQASQDDDDEDSEEDCDDSDDSDFCL